MIQADLHINYSCFAIIKTESTPEAEGMAHLAQPVASHLAASYMGFDCISEIDSLPQLTVG